MARRLLVSMAWLVVAAVVLAVGAALACAGGACRAPWIDAAGLGLANEWRTSGLDAFFAAATWLGSLWLLVPLAVLVAWREIRRSTLRAGIFVPISLLVAAGLAHMAKLIVERPRPELFPAAVQMPADWSFPSAHAMQVAAFALAVVLQSRGEYLVAKVVGAALVVLLVGASRGYLQVHFPTDVVFGTVAAIACVFAVRTLLVEQRSFS